MNKKLEIEILERKCDNLRRDLETLRLAFINTRKQTENVIHCYDCKFNINSKCIRLPNNVNDCRPNDFCSWGINKSIYTCHFYGEDILK